MRSVHRHQNLEACCIHCSLKLSLTITDATFCLWLQLIDLLLLLFIELNHQSM